METYIYWFLLALLLAALEMVTGTFYLLTLGCAMAVGGLAALLGASPVWQVLLSALLAIAGIIALRRWRSAQAGESVNASLDIGQPVKVLQWHADGTARVHYRGAEWDAEGESAHTPHADTLYITEVRGNCLILTQHPPRQH